VKSIPSRVHRNKYGELRGFIKAIDHRRGQYPAKVGCGRMRGDNIRYMGSSQTHAWDIEEWYTPKVGGTGKILSIPMRRPLPASTGPLTT
jgi:hypothetical protein